ncbi:MAG: amidase [Rubrivivax sp.]
MTELHYQSATRLCALIRARKIGCLELLDHYLKRVERHNGMVNAVVWMDKRGARKRAKLADAALARGESWGPLHGLPMTVKEAYDLAGSPSTHGVPALRDNIATTDSVVVARLKAAGAVIFGKTNLPFAMADWQTFNAIYGTTRNPWNTDRVPGGSSGGSAAALAAGLTGAEAGSDIGSSIRNPAHYTGTFGLKPTWGIVSQRGHAPRGWIEQPDVAVVGPMARSAADLELLLDVMSGPDALEADAWKLALAKPRIRTLKGLRIALKLGDANVAVDREYADVLQNLADRLAKAGAKVSDEAAPKVDTTRQHELYLTLYRAALSAGSDTDIANWRAALKTPLGQTNVRMLNGMLQGNTLSHKQWLQMDNERQHLRLRYAEFFEGWDLILCPAAAGPAWPHDHEGERWMRKIEVNGQKVPVTDQLFWSGLSGVVHLPSTVGPAGFSESGLPLGYQAIAGFGRDRTALHFSRLVEREFGGFVAPPGYD